VAHWAGGDFEVIRAATVEVHRVAQAILADLQTGGE
jgi:hypothetical protein